jgi:hypothetical protein
MRLLLVLVAVVLADPALSHSWYEPACCSGVDCAPVQDGLIEDRADGVHVRGYGTLSYTDARLRWSQDDRDHMCVTQDASHKLLCVYRRPKGF